MAEIDWQRVRTVAGQALELSGEERAQFLARACGEDAQLREQVDRLLAQEPSAAADFLEPPKGSAPKDKPGDLAERHRLGEFEILRELGRGGMGVVYVARQESLGRDVAVKVFVETLTTTPRELERFHREARAAARLRHPGIVKVLTDGQSGKTHWFAMELVEGHDLGREVKLQRARGLLSEERPLLPRMGTPEHLPAVARLCADVADALHYAHTQGLVHRDVKPANVLLQPDGRVQLVDFGLVRDDSLGSVTQSGEVRGTPHYMSPEQARVRSVRIDHRTDVYSLGVVLYELTTLRRPFEGRSSAAVISQIQLSEPAHLRKLNPRVPRDLELICATAMAKDPAERYPDAAALAEDLRRFLRHEAVHAQPPAWTGLALRFLRRRRVALAAVFLLALGLAGGTLWAGERTRRSAKARLFVELQGMDGAPVPGSAFLRTIDPLTGSVGPPRLLGRLPVRGMLVDAGDQRVVLRADGGETLELARTLQPGRPLEVRARMSPAVADHEGMVWIPGGTLALRDPNAPLSSINGLDLPIESFWLDACEVSNADYRAFLEATQHPPPLHWSLVRPGEHDDLPVVYVGFLDARAYAELKGKRLPTFPEWTFAARGKENRLYPWPAADGAQLRGNVLRRPGDAAQPASGEAYLQLATPVRSHPEASTATGLFHLYGNVAEWTESPVAQRVAAGFEPLPGFRLVAGHAWNAGTNGHTLATFAWDGIESSFANNKCGFRCARSATP